MSRILFPTDYSPASTAALRYAMALAAQSEATLTVVYVEPPSVPPVGTAALHEGPLDGEEAAFAEQLAALAERFACRYEVRKLRGDPATEIVKLAQQEPAELIVMATAGRSGLRRMLMGSVAEAVVRQAPCPVLTLKEPESTPPTLPHDAS